jgi:peptide/nickel transport system ATP-binding protein
VNRSSATQNQLAPVLRLDNLHVAYNMNGAMVDVVRGVSFDIGRGETYGLVGESGCGKSTTAFAVMNYLGHNGRISAGQIHFRGQNLAALSADELRRLRGRRMAMVYQNPQMALNPALRVGRQIAEVVRHHEGLDKRAARERTLAILEKVHMPDPAAVLERYPHQLSGGMQQRVVIAMALITNPDLVIMDEPTTGLDVTTEVAVLDLLKELKQTFAAAILYISHNLGVIAQICDQVGVMYAGELVESGPVAEVLERPRHPYTLDLLECAPRSDKHYTRDRLRAIQGRVPLPVQRPVGCVYQPRCRFAQEVCRHEQPALAPTGSPTATQLARCFLSNDVVATGPNTDIASPVAFTPRAVDAGGAPPPLLEVTDLHKYHERQPSLFSWLGRRIPPVRAVVGINFAIAPAETFALVGESGCGKTTVGRCVVGLLAPTAGRLTFEGMDVTLPVERRPARLRQSLQMVFQHPDSTLNPRHSVGRTLDRALQRFGVEERSTRRQRVADLLHAVRLDASYADRPPGQLSGGEKQRVAIARAFAGAPDLIVCDEAVSALDVSVQASILNLLVDLKQAQQCAYLFISHDLGVVHYLADRVGVMYLGQFVEVGTVEQIFAAPSHPYTEALLSAVRDPESQATRAPIRLEGVVPSPTNPPAGCSFHTRCPRTTGARCETEPPLWQTSDGGHTIRCHIPLAELLRLQQIGDLS